MLYNYLITILRIINRNRLFTIIHISGLTLGLATAIMIMIMVRFEYSVDRFHEKIKDLYLLRVTLFMEPSNYTSDRSGDAYGPKIASTFPEVEDFCRYRPLPEQLLFPSGDTEIKDAFLEKSVFAVDSSFLSMFSFPLVAGNPDNALKEKYSIVMTEKMAMKLFSTTDIIGEIVRVNDEHNFVVTGIAKNIPKNTFFQFDYLVPYDFLCDLDIETNSFGGTMTSVFFLFHDGATPEKINDQLPGLSDEWHDADIEYLPFLYPFYDAHSTGETQNGKAMFVFLLIAALILIIACINYTNLSTARFTVRAREVGIRKALGANRSMLFFQFLGEALLKSFIAVDIALLIVEALLPTLNSYYETQLTIPYSNPEWLLILAGLVIFTGVTAGTYPAIILASFNPVKVLKNPWLHGHKGNFIRKMLVTVQFTIAITFIIVAIFLVRQHDHIRKGDERIRRENVIYFETKGHLWEKYPEFRQEATQIKGIEHVATASKVPTNIDIGEFEYGLEDVNQTSLAMISWADWDYAEMFDMEMIEGQFFREGFKTDEKKVVINKKMQDFFQLSDPVGQTFYIYHEPHKIAGVIEDFDFFPLNLTDQMLILKFDDISSYIFISFDDNFTPGTLTELEEIYHDFNPAYPFEYEYVLDHELPLDQMFNNGKPFLWFFTAMGIFISLLGLFGLASFTANQKVIEIGIRKSFGASTLQIVKQLALQFSKPVIIAIIIGFSLAYLIISYLFSFFNYPVPLSWYVFALTGIAVILLSQGTVIGQALRAARQNPVQCLRHE